MTAVGWNFGDGNVQNWNRSCSEPDLTLQNRRNRCSLKNLHEFIAIDDLKYFRHRLPNDAHTRSNICLYNTDEPVVPFGLLKTEYCKQYRQHTVSPGVPRTTLLRRATSLRLEGLMQLLSEHQEKYHWYTHEDLQFSRAFSVRNPENLQVGGNMKNSSYLTYPMLDASVKILPREMFREDRPPSEVKSLHTNKLLFDKFSRDVAAQEQHKCHLQLRAQEQAAQHVPIPSEYKRQYVQQFPIEKAQSIPQISNIKLQGEFMAVPEYQDSYKFYANYSKSAPIKKHDNLRVSGAEVQAVTQSQNYAKNLPEYRDKFNDPPKHIVREKFPKTEDHLQPHGDFTKDIPEYNESFRDPNVKEMPKRGKCREPYLRLRGKIEFNPEYRNTYLDFPRSRPVVNKPVSSFHLPESDVTNKASSTFADNLHQMPSHDVGCTELQTVIDTMATDLTATPEYRRAKYNYQIRERTPASKKVEPAGDRSKMHMRKSSDSSLETNQPATHKPRTSRPRQTKGVPPPREQTFDHTDGNAAKKPVKFGRRASILQNAASCRGNSSIVEGNPKYAVGCRRNNLNGEQQKDAFVVLDQSSKPSNWMKKTWYDS